MFYQYSISVLELKLQNKNFDLPSVKKQKNGIFTLKLSMGTTYAKIHLINENSAMTIIKKFQHLA